MTDDELLTPVSAAAENPELRAAILRRTGRHVRRRNSWRRAWRGVVAVALLGGAFALGRASKDDAVTLVTVVAAPLPVPPVVPSPSPQPVALSAEQLEIRAELAATPEEAADWYRQAGDAFLQAKRNIRQASRCYRLHLENTPPTGRAIAAADSWLLMSLKP